jgi:hypothetical protein
LLREIINGYGRVEPSEVVPSARFVKDLRADGVGCGGYNRGQGRGWRENRDHFRGSYGASN